MRDFEEVVRKLSFNSTYILNAAIKKLFNFYAWWTATKHKEPLEDCFDIQAQGPGHLPTLPNGQSGSTAAHSQGKQRGRTCVFVKIL